MVLGLPACRAGKGLWTMMRCGRWSTSSGTCHPREAWEHHQFSKKKPRSTNTWSTIKASNPHMLNTRQRYLKFNRKGRNGREGIRKLFRENSLILHVRGNILGVLRSALWSFAEEGMVPARRSE